MSIPFNLERAKAGDKFRAKRHPDCKIMNWYSFDLRGKGLEIYIQFEHGMTVFCEYPEGLEMIPKEKVMWGNVYKDGNYFEMSRLYDTEKEAMDKGKILNCYHSTIPVTIKMK